MKLLDPAWKTNAWIGGIRQSVKIAKANHAVLRSMLPDIHYITQDLIAEGDRVAQRWSVNATHSGAFLGLAPTGRRIVGSGVSIFRFAAGRIVEHCAWVDELGLLEQLGVTLAAERTLLRHYS